MKNRISKAAIALMMLAATPSPAKAQMQNGVESRIDSLRSHRSAMSESEYQKALEPLMLDLAEKSRALKALEARKP